MVTKKIFERHELKFLVNDVQRYAIESCNSGELVPDEFGESTIRNVYYDTPDSLLIRRSIDGGIYKEKLRLRSYKAINENDAVFIEMKKKYNGIVYKRRIQSKLDSAVNFLNGKEEFANGGQIEKELAYFRDFYKTLIPSMYICYDRCSYFAADDPDVRVTFDKHIRWQNTECTLTAEPYGEELLDVGFSLMEVKVADAVPLWLSKLINENGVPYTSFSKYGRAYLSNLQTSKIKKGVVSCA